MIPAKAATTSSDCSVAGAPAASAMVTSSTSSHGYWAIPHPTMTDPTAKRAPNRAAPERRHQSRIRLRKPPIIEVPISGAARSESLGQSWCVLGDGRQRAQYQSAGEETYSDCSSSELLRELFTAGADRVCGEEGASEECAAGHGDCSDAEGGNGDPGRPDVSVTVGRDAPRGDGTCSGSEEEGSDQ